MKEVNKEIQKEGAEIQNEQIEEINADKRTFAQNNTKYSEEGAKKIEDANYKIVEQKKGISNFNSGRADEVKEKSTKAIESEKRNTQKFNERKSADQGERLKTNRAKAQEIERHNSEPGPDEYEKNPLSDSYPQGITEEKEVENGKVVLTRFKVVGNKVDVYKKVMGLNGNYFFKNGVSCTQNTWDRESTVVLE